MSVAYRSSATAAVTGTTGTSVTCDKPSGTASGDILIAQVKSRNAPVTPTSPAWDLIETYIDVSIGRHAIFRRVAGGSEPATYTFDQSGSAGRIAVGISAYSGGDTSSPISASEPLDESGGGASASCTAPSETVPDNNTIVLRMWGGNTANGIVAPGTAGTEQYRISSNQADRQNATLATEVEASSHTASSEVATANNASCTARSAWTVALKSATASFKAAWASHSNVILQSGEPG